MANKFILNHDTRVHLKIGQRFRLPNGSVVKRLSKHKVKYYTRYGSVLARFVRYRKNRYINLIVKVPKEAKISGECSGSKNVAHGIFKNELIIEATEHFHHLKISKKCERHAKRKCEKRHKGKMLKYCIFDTCSKLRK